MNADSISTRRSGARGRPGAKMDAQKQREKRARRRERRIIFEDKLDREYNLAKERQMADPNWLDTDYDPGISVGEFAGNYIAAPRYKGGPPTRKAYSIASLRGGNPRKGGLPPWDTPLGSQHWFQDHGLNNYIDASKWKGIYEDIPEQDRKHLYGWVKRKGTVVSQNKRRRRSKSKRRSRRARSGRKDRSRSKT